MSRRLLLALVAASLGVNGCFTPPTDHYYWGSYEVCLGGACLDPREERVEEQIRLLSRDIENARLRKLPVPPGLHATLGYLHFLSGNLESAAIEYAAEKELYPESAVFVDGLLKRTRT